MRYTFFALLIVSPAIGQQALPAAPPSLGEQLLRDAIRQRFAAAPSHPANPMALKPPILSIPRTPKLVGLTAVRPPVLSAMPRAKCATPLTEVPVPANTDRPMLLPYQGPNDSRIMLAPMPVCRVPRK